MKGLNLRRSGLVVAVAAAGLFLTSCGRKGGSSRPPPCAPTIMQVIPQVGGVTGGEPVTVVTACFAEDFTLTVPQVFFGSDAATSVVATNATTVTLLTPPHAVAEAVDVVVQTTSETATLAGGFTYMSAPPPPPCSVTLVTPAQGVRDVPNTVMVEGTNFPTTLPAPTVQFGAGNLGTNVVLIDATRLQVDTPTVAVAGTVDVIVTPVGGTPCIGLGLYTFLNPPPPPCTVLDVMPNQGFRNVSSTVIVAGTDFPLAPPAPTVEFGAGNFGTNVVQFGPGQLQVDTPIVPTAGPVDIIVTPSTGPACTGLNLYTFLDPPVTCNISGVSPNWGPELGGTLVTITGTGFTPATQVFLGASSAPTVFIDSMTLQITAPPGTAGTVDLIADIGGGTTCVLLGAYTYTPCSPLSCTITMVNPSSGVAGDTVMITGSAFEAGAQVFFGTVQAPVTSETPPGEIVVTAPDPVGGQLVVDVLVINPSGICCIEIDGFTYIACNITGVTPIRGSTVGGESVTISGIDFDPMVEVYFGGIQADPGFVMVDISGTQITCLTPGSPSAGVVSVEVRNLLSGSSCINLCAYVYDLPGGGFCSVSGLNPSSGPATGGNLVTIQGVNFDVGTRVHFGPDPASTVVLVSPNQIQVLAPPYGGGLGPAPVIVDIAVSPAGSNPCVISSAYQYQ